MARFETFTVGSQVLVLPKGLKFEYPAEPDANYIDTFVAAKAQEAADEPVGDLHRRGVLPPRLPRRRRPAAHSPEEFTKFVEDKAPDKRSKLIDELLNRKEFVEIWVQKWAEMLQVRSQPNGSELQGDVPLLQLAGREALQEHADGRDGQGASRGQRRHLQEAPRPTSTRTRPRTCCSPRTWRRSSWACASSAPSATTTRSTAGPRTTTTGSPRSSPRSAASRGKTTARRSSSTPAAARSAHPVGGRQMKPKFLGGVEPETAGKDRRVILAQWLASKDNPWFAASRSPTACGPTSTATASSSRSTTSASPTPRQTPSFSPNSASGSPSRSTTSRGSSATSATRGPISDPPCATTSNELDEKNFAHANLRRIKAENLLDCISQATDTKDKFQGLPIGAHAPSRSPTAAHPPTSSPPSAAPPARPSARARSRWSRPCRRRCTSSTATP